MKQILTVIFLILFISSLLGQDKSNLEESIQVENWYLIEYLDSTIINKKIYKYSGACASYAYKITFDRNNMDSISFIGYHESWKDKLDEWDEVSYTMGDDSQYWKINFDNESLTIQEFFRDHDTTANIFSRRENIPPLKEYFSKNIFTGTYIRESNNSTIIFNNDYTITGLDSIVNYSLIIDFWEEGNGMDGMYLYTKDGNFEEYHWWFDGRNLNLRKVRGAYENESDWIKAKVVGETTVLKKIK